MGGGHALVIGGSRGLGRALVELWALEGRRISVISRHGSSKSHPDNPNVRCWPADLSDRKRLSKVLSEAVRQNGKLGSLVFFQRYRGSGDDWNGEMQVSLTATKNVVESLADHFMPHGGAIVMVSSINAHKISPDLPLSYHVAKTGLTQMARYYAVRLGPRGIRVNSVSPGTVLKAESKRFYLKNKALMEFYKKISPLGRMGTADEVARVIAFLCGEGASYITGQDVVVDGGLSLEWQEAVAQRLVAQ